jgi:hypothetical protein
VRGNQPIVQAPNRSYTHTLCTPPRPPPQLCPASPQGPSATLAEIRSAFRRELLKYHPDVLIGSNLDPAAAAQVRYAWGYEPRTDAHGPVCTTVCVCVCVCVAPLWLQRTRALYDAYAVLRDPKKVGGAPPLHSLCSASLCSDPSIDGDLTTELLPLHGMFAVVYSGSSTTERTDRKGNPKSTCSNAALLRPVLGFYHKKPHGVGPALYRSNHRRTGVYSQAATGSGS